VSATNRSGSARAESLVHAATGFATAPLRILVAASAHGRSAELRARRKLASAAEPALLAALDAVLGRLMNDELIDRVLARAKAERVAEHVVDRILEDGIAEHVAERAFSGPELERMLESAFKSALPEELVAQLLSSEAVWMLVDEIARSPSVTDAIAHQGTGFLDQVVAKGRDRSRRGDERIQRVADRLRIHHASLQGEDELGNAPG
jgi:hypothetical protein